MEKVLNFEGKKYISSKRVSELYGYSSDYVGQLCRAGKLTCRMVGRSWYVTEDSIINYKLRTDNSEKISLQRKEEYKAIKRNLNNNKNQPLLLLSAGVLRGDENVGVITSIKEDDWNELVIHKKDVNSEINKTVSESVKEDVLDGSSIYNSAKTFKVAKIIRKVETDSDSSRNIIFPKRVFASVLLIAVIISGIGSVLVNFPQIGRSMIDITSETAEMFNHGLKISAQNVRNDFLLVSGDLINSLSKVADVVGNDILTNVNLTAESFSEETASIISSIGDSIRSVGRNVRVAIRDFLGIDNSSSPSYISENNLSIRTTTSTTLVINKTISQKPTYISNGVDQKYVDDRFTLLLNQISFFNNHELRQTDAIYDNIGRSISNVSTNINDSVNSNIVSAISSGSSNFSGSSLTISGNSNLSFLNAGSTTVSALDVGGPIHINDMNPPSSTTNTLYADAGGLYWSGNLIGGATTGNWNTDGTNVWRNGGNVGIGTSTPSANLDVIGRIAAGTRGVSSHNSVSGATPSVLWVSQQTNNTTLSNIALETNLEITNSVDSSQGYFGSVNYVGTATSTTANLVGSGRLIGLQNEAKHYGTGTLANVVGLVSYALNERNGTITNAYGGRFGIYNEGGGVMTNAYGVYIKSPFNSLSTLTNSYGLYLEDQSVGSTSYAVYSVGGKNYFGGNVGIGTSSPFAKLSVAGDTYLGGNLTAIGTLSVSGQTTLGNASTTNISISNSLTVGQATITDRYLHFDYGGSTNYIDVLAPPTDNNPGGDLFIRSGDGRGNGENSAIYLLAGLDGQGLNRGLVGIGGSNSFGVHYALLDATLDGSMSDLTFKFPSQAGTFALKSDIIGWASSTNPTSIYFTGSGNVGIGTTSPTNKFEVSGNTFLGGNLTATGTLNVADSLTASSTTATGGTTDKAISLKILSGIYPALSSNGTLYVAASNSGSTLPANYSGYFNTAGFNMNDNNGMVFGAGGITRSNSIYGVNYSGVGAGFMGVADTDYWGGGAGRYWLIADGSDKAYNFAHAPQANPTLFIHSANQTTTQWLGLTHDGTNGVISTGAGSLILSPTAGNVGIGTSTPSSKLHIFSNSSTNDYDLRIENLYWDRGIKIGIDSSASPAIQAYKISTGDYFRNLLLNPHGGNVGIGTTTPLAKLDITGTAGSSDIFAISSSTNARLLTVTAAGNVGIGTTSPGAKIEVFSGTVNVATQITDRSILFRRSLDGVSGSQGLIHNPDTRELRLISNGGGGFLTFYDGVGTEGMRLTNGNLSIGTTTPSAKLEVSGSADALRLSGVSNPQLRFLTNSSNSSARSVFMAINQATLGDFVIRQSSSNSADPSSGTTRFQITPSGDISLNQSSGNVGIGTTTPTGQFEVWGNANSGMYAGDFVVDSANKTVYVGRQSNTAGDNSTFIVRNRAGGQLIRADAPNAYVSLSSSVSGIMTETLRAINGNIGIGTTTPLAKLDITGTAGSSDIFAISSSTNARLLTVTAAGNVGIGTTSPATKLHVNGGGGALTLSNDYANGSDKAGIIYFGTGWSKIQGDTLGLSLGTYHNSGLQKDLTINYNGNVGIGTTTPVYRLDIVGSFNQHLIVGNVGQAGRMSFRRGTDGLATASFGWDSAGTGTLFSLLNGSSGGEIRINPNNADNSGFTTIYSNNAETLRVVGGNVGIGTTTPSQKLDIANGNLRFTRPDRPSTPSATASSTAGVLNGSYRYRVTFVNSAGETEVSDNSSTVSPSNKYVDVTIPVSTDSSVTSRKIYRNKTAEGVTGTMYLVATISDNTTTYYADNIADGSLGATNPYRPTIGGVMYINSTHVLTMSPTLTAIGYSALQSVTGPNNTAVGNASLKSNTSGAANTAIGDGTLFTNTTGGQNNAFGYTALYGNTTGSYNTAIGRQSLYANTTGSENDAIGYFSLGNNVTGGDNVAIGFNSSRYNTSATSTVAIGSQSGGGTGTSFYNKGSISIGFKAGYNFGNSSDYNTLLGYQAGYNITTGMDNIIIGTATSSTSIQNLTTGSQNILIGSNISFPSATASGQLNIGNLIFGTGLTGTGSTVSSGNIGIGTTTPSAKLHISGTMRNDTFAAGTLVTDASGNITVSSDERLKNIHGNFNRGLSDILNINPILYKWKDTTGYDTVNTYAGFSAQNVKLSIPEAVGEDGKGMLTLSDRPILATLVNAIKELNTTVNSRATSTATTTIIQTVEAPQIDLVLIASTTAHTLASSTSFLERVALAVKNSISMVEEWVVEKITATTGYIKNIFAEKVTTKELCIEDVCVNKEQLQALLLNTHSSSTPPIVSTSTPSTSTPPVINVVSTSTSTTTIQIINTVSSTTPPQIIATSTPSADTNATTTVGTTTTTTITDPIPTNTTPADPASSVNQQSTPAPEAAPVTTPSEPVTPSVTGSEPVNTP